MEVLFMVIDFFNGFWLRVEWGYLSCSTHDHQSEGWYSGLHSQPVEPVI